MKTKKILLSIGTVATASAPIAGVIACGSSEHATISPEISKLLATKETFEGQVKPIFDFFNEGVATTRIKTQKMLAASGQKHYLSNDFALDKVLFMSSSSAGAAHIQRGVYKAAVAGNGMENLLPKKDVLILSNIESSKKPLLQGYGNFQFTNAASADKVRMRDAMIKYLAVGPNYDEFVNHAYNAGYAPTVKGAAKSSETTMKGATNAAVEKSFTSASSLPSGIYAKRFEDALISAGQLYSDAMKSGKQQAPETFYNNFINKIAQVRSRRSSPKTTYSNKSANFVIQLDLNEGSIADVAKIFTNAWVAATGNNASEFPVKYSAGKLQGNTGLFVKMGAETFKIDLVKSNSSISARTQMGTKELGDAWVGYAAEASELKTMGIAYDIYSNTDDKKALDTALIGSAKEEGELAVDGDTTTMYSLPVLKSTSVVYINRILLNNVLAKLMNSPVHVKEDGTITAGAATDADLKYSGATNLPEAPSVTTNNTKVDIPSLVAGQKIDSVSGYKLMLTVAKALQKAGVSAANPADTSKSSPVWAYATDDETFYDIIPSLFESTGKFKAWGIKDDWNK